MEIKESLACEDSFVRCSVNFGNKKSLAISGHGAGILDAFYTAMLKDLSFKFSSLANIKFVDFRVNAEGLSRYKVNPGSKAFVEAHLMTEGKKNKSVLFHARSRSVNAATLNAACDAIEFYINCETAFVALRKFLDNAKKRNRPDLIQVVTNKIINMYKLKLTNNKQ